jgi:hypothetical protein
LGKPFKVGVGDAKVRQMGGGGPEVVAVQSAATAGPGDDLRLVFAIKMAVLSVVWVDDVGQCIHRSGFGQDRQGHLQIGRGHQLAFAQGEKGGGLMPRFNPEGDAGAGRVLGPVKRKDKAGALHRAAMVDRSHAEAAVPAAKARDAAFRDRETRVPDQRSVAEDPECVVHGWPCCVGTCKHRSTSKEKGGTMRKLLFLLIAATALWSGYWVVGSNAVRDGVNGFFADAGAQGLVAENAGVSVKGFPNRFDLTLDQVKLADPASGAGWEAPFVQVFAMTWKPWHIIAAFAPEQQVFLPDDVITVTSQDLKASLRAKPSTELPLAEVRLAGTSLGLVSQQGWTLGLGDFTLGLRAEPALGLAGYELGFDLAPLTPDPGFVQAVKAVAIPDLPASDLPDTVESLWGSVFLTFSAPLDRHSGETKPYLTRVEINQFNFAWGQLAASAKGVIEADDQGFAAGEITVEVTNWDRLPAILVAAGVVKPEMAATIARGMQALAAQSPDLNLLSLTLKLAEGQMSFGPFPLGPAPRLTPPTG